MGFFGKMKEDFKKATEDGKAMAAGKAVRLEYLGGHPKVQAGLITVSSSTEEYKLLIDGNEVQVVKMEWDEKGKRSGGKAAAGAIVGGVLTGGLGLLAGAAIGGRKKDNSLAVITYQDGPLEGTAYFRCDQKEYQKLAALLA
ncbi:hypothetical protein ACFQ3J_08685 [Paenibacillus provencensis]|uniref:Uncharacterized protein n=1 Tax=Paenibacillus provencensis TaxID=441151 RepID=A0ABW3PVH7_9BACL|nr:hypothetical protein [Paenibacillus sp. MER 78]MCM3129035.1 hypothetical protein [Paenibacillus sp. MER 78]